MDSQIFWHASLKKLTIIRPHSHKTVNPTRNAASKLSITTTNRPYNYVGAPLKPMKMPVLSIIIPTHKRPQLLSRAIASAIEGTEDIEVEIIVVPNGPDDSWKAVAAQLKEETRVKWHPLKTGNACIARNHGLDGAQGKYIRFLDDDDYLYPAAREQIQLIERSGAEICSGLVESVDAQGGLLSLTNTPSTSDLVSAILATKGFTFTTGNIFLKAAILGTRWREHVYLYDDYLWMVDLVTDKDWKWVHYPKPVGAYFQHFQPRLSFERRSLKNSKDIISSILGLRTALKQSSRLNMEREKAIATAILSHAHSAFPANPIYLTNASRVAKNICSDASPDHPMFQRTPYFRKHFIATEWLLLIPRIISRSYRRAAWHIKRNAFFKYGPNSK